eukprot:223937_1
MALSEQEAVIIGCIIGATLLIVFGIIIWYIYSRNRLHTRYMEVKLKNAPRKQRTNNIDTNSIARQKLTISRNGINGMHVSKDAPTNRSNRIITIERHNKDSPIEERSERTASGTGRTDSALFDTENDVTTTLMHSVEDGSIEFVESDEKQIEIQIVRVDKGRNRTNTGILDKTEEEDDDEASVLDGLKMTSGLYDDFDQLIHQVHVTTYDHDDNEEDTNSDLSDEVTDTATESDDSEENTEHTENTDYKSIPIMDDKHAYADEDIVGPMDSGIQRDSPTLSLDGMVFS